MNNRSWRQPAIQQPQQPQQQQINIPLVNIAGFAFNPLTIVAIDLQGYVEGEPGRAIHLHLAHDCGNEFVDEAADQFYYWYLVLTGQAKIDPATT